MKKVSLAIHPLHACCLALFLALEVSSSAQQTPPPPADQAEINRQLLQRIEELEKEVQRLTSQSATSAAPVVAPEPTPVAETPPVRAVNDRLTLNVFGNVGFHATDAPEVSSNTFNIGNLDIFMTSRLSEKVSLLGEVLFIANSADIERLLLRYRYNDYFAFAMGRYHTSIDVCAFDGATICTGSIDATQNYWDARMAQDAPDARRPVGPIFVSLPGLKTPSAPMAGAPTRTRTVSNPRPVKSR